MATFHVYILASHSGTLYVGVTRDLIRRLYQHRTGQFAGFSRRYRTHKLVYFETTTEARATGFQRRVSRSFAALRQG